MPPAEPHNRAVPEEPRPVSLPVSHSGAQLPISGGDKKGLTTSCRAYHISQTIRHTFPSKIWEKSGGASYSPNVAYSPNLAHYRISALKGAIKYLTTFFASNFFVLFSSFKT